MIGLLIQGQDTYIDQLYDFYKDQNNIIFSGWEGQKKIFKNTILSKPPSNPGYGNSNMQFRGAYIGAEYAKSLGFTYLLKIRSDFCIANFNLLLENLDTTRFNYLAYHDWDGGYLIDYMIGMPIDDMIEVYKSDTSYKNMTAEKQMMERIKSRGVSSVNYMMPILLNKNITIKALKWDKEMVSNIVSDNKFIYPEKI